MQDIYFNVHNLVFWDRILYLIATYDDKTKYGPIIRN